MQKLYIAKNKYGGYYAKIKNKYYGCEKIVSVVLPQGTELEESYGTYTCEYWLDCFKRKNGEVELTIRVSRIVSPFKPVENPYEVYNNTNDPELPF